MAGHKGTTVSLAAALALLCLSATANANQPVALTDSQLDLVTAGLSVGFSTGAIAGGGQIAWTNTAGVAEGTTTPLPLGGNQQTGVAGGVATAVSPGGEAATEAGSGGSIAGRTLANIGVNGTVTGAGGSLSIGATFITGGIR